MQLPSPSDLQYFLEVASALNVSRAAERLGISQPTLSLAIQRLEGNLGRPLLVRNKSGVTLTHTGQKLSTQIRSLVDEWEKIRGEALKDENEIRGRYTIGCHPSVALFSLPLFLADLLEKFPELEIKLFHDLSRRVTEEVISFRVDFGIVVNPWDHPDLVIKKLWTDEVGLWTSQKPTKLQDIESGEAVLICDPELLQSQSILKDLTKKKIKFKRTIPTGNLEVVTSLVNAGAGVGILPGRVATSIKSYKLRPLGKEAPTFSDTIALVYRADAQNTRAGRELARLLQSTLAQYSQLPT